MSGQPHRPLPLSLIKLSDQHRNRKLLLKSGKVLSSRFEPIEIIDEGRKCIIADDGRIIRLTRQMKPKEIISFDMPQSKVIKRLKVFGSAVKTFRETIKSIIRSRNSFNARVKSITVEEKESNTFTEPTQMIIDYEEKEEKDDVEMEIVEGKTFTVSSCTKTFTDTNKTIAIVFVLKLLCLQRKLLVMNKLLLLSLYNKLN